MPFKMHKPLFFLSGLSSDWKHIYLIHIDTISMELSINVFKGVAGQNFYKMMHFLLLKIVFIIGNSADWWNAALFVISSGSSLFDKVPVYRNPE